MPEVIPNLLYVIVSTRLPISAILILVIDLVIDLGFELFISLIFAWDKSESSTGLMKLPAHKPITPASMERRRRLATHVFASVIDADLAERPSRQRERFEHTEDEILVDAGLLSRAYLEVGIM
ncbi:hypothetical protein BGZ93_004931 [Podila epicladia]|nr:hypothetical protein BGZ92_001430 [Podila epicladia]KAG0096162.1 hypothetical protein BGZ93_004931 [Podila epicladia]